MIKFIVTEKNDITKILLKELNRENLLGACKMEDEVSTTQEEKNELLNAIKYYFNGIPFITNGRLAAKDDVLYSAFFYISASPLVRKWVEENNQPFGITLELDLQQNTTKIICSSISEWYRINRIMIIKDFRNEN